MGHFARPMLLFLWQGVPLRGLLTPPTPLCLFAATESAQERNLLPPQTATMKSLFVRLLLQGHANTKLPSPMTSHQQTVPPEDKYVKIADPIQDSKDTGGLNAGKKCSGTWHIT
eukprot:CAMPEP_0184338758 /NCGR_PEP_ID=MMETSP1089-20130417/7357_1 /TAXON_ID=38269 ORGANISM="Gloeochaete wittrockiana, Strain SAG46.84" /NCGR_SAMPLE_ID=MMETSP1089 /ASSEMBLY_ACC=CAM_ASM_000445 /LENGTH=113 /DNA_ID=CAMNT_0026665509 /DNA_START=32 /DNA_END=374 /DNA_ORIENTATION=+